jgi:hypothetical protein
MALILINLVGLLNQHACLHMAELWFCFAHATRLSARPCAVLVKVSAAAAWSHKLRAIRCINIKILTIINICICIVMDRLHF